MTTTSSTGHDVPHLQTALSGPLLQLETLLLDHQPVIEHWFREQCAATRPPVYSSVDLRNAGFKVAPVDTNLFPAGFNNLSPALIPLAVLATQAAFELRCPTARNVLIVAESHTRNLFYLESLKSLQDIVEKAGYRAIVGTLREDIDPRHTIDLPSGRRITLHAIHRDGNKIGAEGVYPCMVLLNNDLSGGRPDILENLEQTLAPPLALGWSNRLKSQHFSVYREVAEEFSRLINCDPWLITPLFRNCGQIDFKNREGNECLSKNIELLLSEIKTKYDEYGIDKKPFVIVKADAGTYGMAIMSIDDPDQVFQLNRKQRTHMSSTKEGRSNSSVIIQEGVYTFETWPASGAVAEPVVYMIDRYVVGGFYRVHTKRGDTENLNAPGMHFEPLAFAESCSTPDPGKSPDAEPNRFYAYGVIARLAMLAAAREIAQEAKP